MTLETVIGLETHVELSTCTKAFCGCANRYGAAPNTLVCPVCMALPGALPLLNAEAVRLSVIAGYALHCDVQTFSRFDRKNYFYPDMPKAYQITQFYHPLCLGGWLDIDMPDGVKRVRLTRIHMEEDAGKLQHIGDESLLDMNRCGVPLIEIVTEPDLHSAQEASAYLRALRTVLTFAGVSRCRMNEGSLRCDVNVSVHAPGTPLGERCEIKNLNSFQSVERAIEAEVRRQTAIIEGGGVICRETRRYDDRTGTTASMRRKEDSADYRYFPEPDLPPLRLAQSELDAIRAAMAPAPADFRVRMISDYGLSAETARLLTAEKWLADYAMRLFALSASPKTAANLLTGEGFRLMSLRDTRHNGERDPEDWPISAERLAALSDLLASGTINAPSAKALLARLVESDFDPAEVAEREQLTMIRDTDVLRSVVADVLAAEPKLVATYLSGKLTAAKALMGRCMAQTRGRADAVVLEQLLNEELNKM